MRDLTSSRLFAAAGAALALLALPAASLAGTGRLVSPWMSRAPAIDGRIEAAEWAEAALLDLGHGVVVRLGNDRRTLYLAVLDPRPAAFHYFDQLTLLFDDEGGSARQLDDGLWTSAVCHQSPALGEGEIWFRYLHESQYFEWYSVGGLPGFCSFVPVGDRMSSSIALQPEGLSYEIAIPLDGPGPVVAARGERLGVSIHVLDEWGDHEVCYPAACTIAPADFQNLMLASGGCNSGPQGFGSGVTPVGLPLDWLSERAYGSGPGWLQSTLFADPVFCQDNVTGGDGAAACISNALFTSTGSTVRLHLPVASAGQGTMILRLLANFQSGAFWDALSFGATLLDGTLDYLLHWQFTSHGGPSGPGERVELAIPMASDYPPIDLIFTHYTADGGGQEGGFAEIDDVELVCGPLLFSDAFETGLTTHWSANTL